MGLFDQYQFDQGSYGGGGSLIDRLLSQLQTQGQYQPSQGFAPNPMDANAQMQPQQQNTPIDRNRVESGQSDCKGNVRREQRDDQG